MAKFDMDQRDDRKRLLGDLGEAYFKHFSAQKNFAYSKPEDIGWDFLHKRIVRFKKGFARIDVRIPDQLRNLLLQIIEPNPSYPESPAYSFDFLTCHIDPQEIENGGPDLVLQKRLSKFTVVEIKTGDAPLTGREIEVKRWCQNAGVKYTVFRIGNMGKPVSDWNLETIEKG